MATIKNHVLVNGSKIGKATVVSDALLKKGSCIPGTTITPTSVTFHQTACIDVDAPKMSLALKNANNDPYAGTSKSNYRKASWTITVGYDKIVQNVPLNWKAYAQGTKAGNDTSISIEMCMYTDKTKQYDTYLNAISLFKTLLREYKSTLTPKAHYDWSKKNCPEWLREGKYGYTWGWFKEKLTEKESTQAPNSNSSTNNTFIVRVIVDALNIRKGAGTNYGIVRTIRDKGAYTIVKTNEDKTWGYLKSGEGWISINKKYVKYL